MFYYYSLVLQKYAEFSGRARRAEYWYFTLVNFIISLALSLFANLVGNIGLVIYVLYTLAVLIPGLAVTVRRLHDIDKSGWMILVGLIPVIGHIWLFILMVLDSTPGKNQYGPNPKGVTDNSD